MLTVNRFHLMHGEVQVAILDIDSKGRISAIGGVDSPQHLPLGTYSEDTEELLARISAWWSKRAIPASRLFLNRKMMESGINTPESLMAGSLGLSLSDSYWISPWGSDLQWDDANYFRNGFSSDLGDFMFDGIPAVSDFSSPDASLNGNLKKRWKIIEGRRVMMKTGSGIAMQEPFNEAIATEIMHRLGIECVDYVLGISQSGSPFTRCDCFADENTEFVSALQVLRSVERQSDETLYSLTVRAFGSIGLHDVEPFMDRMLTVDYIMANEDRHFGNFGILRDPKTLKPRGFAPIFDTGASLGYNTPTVWISEGYDLRCNPFKVTHGEQIRLVHSFDWIDFEALEGIGELAKELMIQPGTTIDTSRAVAVSQYLEHRISRLRGMANDPPGFRDDPHYDLVLADE